jgi:hypothetical protein
MLELLKAELRRYRTAALLFAAASLVIDFLMFRTSIFLEAPYFVQGMGLAVFVLAAMALAIFQFGSYRTPARWLWLLHRPLPRLQTFFAIHLASAILIVLAAGLPMQLALLATQAEHARVVDARHFLDAVHIPLFCILAWQAASYAMLARHRGAFIVLLAPVMLAALYFASAYVLFVPMSLSLLLMGGALFTVFRPERRSPPKQPFALACAAIPVMLCFYFIMYWGTTIAFTIGFSATGMGKAKNHVPGGFLEALTASEELKLIDGELAKSADPRAQTWRDQIKSGSERRFLPHMRRFPVRDQASNAGYSRLYARNESWSFSHDRMRFVARNEKLDSLMETTLGPRGTSGTAQFSQPAVSVSATPAVALVYTPQTLAQLDRKTLTMRQLMVLAGDEVIASLPEIEDDSLSVITNRRFIEYAWPVVGGILQERFSVPLAGSLSDLGAVHSAKVANGNLVTFLFGQQQENGETNSQVTTFYVQGNKFDTVHQRTLVLDVGFLYTQRSFWMSPVMFALFEVPRVLLDSGKGLDAGYTTDSMTLMLPHPLSARILALAFLLASTMGAWLWLRREKVSSGYRAAWIIACLAIGLPALFALVVLQKKQSAGRASDVAGALPPEREIAKANLAVG